MTNLAIASNLPLPHVARAWVVLSERGVVDQVCGSEREARREVRDLKAMGFEKARMVVFGSWQEADDYEAKLGGL